MIDLYDGEIADVDAAFGGFLDLLRETHRYEDSLIILVADHGEAFGEHGTLGHGKTLCQEEMHVPLIVRFPRGEFGGVAVDQEVGLIDVYPTVLAAAGVAPSGPLPLAGVDLTRVASAPAAPRRRPLFAEVSMGTQNTRDLVGVIDENGCKRVVDMSVVPNPETRECTGLWDTRADPAEEADLLSALPARSAYCEQLIAYWLTAQVALHQPAAAVAPTEMSEELRKQLEALGYVE
jgi:arylsulfatase A-like enzyme